MRVSKLWLSPWHVTGRVVSRVRASHSVKCSPCRPGPVPSPARRRDRARCGPHPALKAPSRPEYGSDTVRKYISRKMASDLGGPQATVVKPPQISQRRCGPRDLCSFVTLWASFPPPLEAGIPRHLAGGLCAGLPFSLPRHLKKLRAIVPEVTHQPGPPACEGRPVSTATAAAVNVIPAPWGRGCAAPRKGHLQRAGETWHPLLPPHPRELPLCPLCPSGAVSPAFLLEQSRGWARG